MYVCVRESIVCRQRQRESLSCVSSATCTCTISAEKHVFQALYARMCVVTAARRRRAHTHRHTHTYIIPFAVRCCWRALPACCLAVLFDVYSSWLAISFCSAAALLLAHCSLPLSLYPTLSLSALSFAYASFSAGAQIPHGAN